MSAATSALPPEKLVLLGFGLIEEGRLAEAEQSFRLAIAAAPFMPRAWLGLGNALMLGEQPVEAVAAFRGALEQRPDYPDARANLGMALDRAGELEAAVAELAAAGEAHPGNFSIAVNHALSARKLGLWREALASFERASGLRPDDRKLRYEIGLLRLGTGEWSTGWQEYEHRWVGNGLNAPLLPGIPEWRGEALAGKTILVLPEQGMGDMIQFIRYTRLLAGQGGKVVIACHAPLVRLFASIPWLAGVVAEGKPLPPADFQIMMLSLPERFRTMPASVPAEIPYLAADPGARARWAMRLAAHSGLKIGLVWAGGPHRGEAVAAAVDIRRSLDLAAFAPLAGLEGICLVSLQKGEAAAQAGMSGLPVIDWTEELADFADTAALVAELDLIITVDTAVAHLAGALGKPVWVLSRLDGCWRWLLDRHDSPWYPTLRLFRQTRRDDWDSVVIDVRAALAAKLRPGYRG